MRKSPPGRAPGPERVDKAAPLPELLRRIRSCRICRDTPAGNRPLPHEPRPVVVVSTRARILIAGQAPGIRVHASGIPFDDPSGDRLRNWLDVKADRFHDANYFAIVPMGLCFPGHDAHGGDLPPRRECAPAWRQALLDSMPQIELVLAIGLHAHAWHLGSLRGVRLDDTVRDWRRIMEARPGGRTVIPLPHPSWRNSGWLKRNPWFEAELLPVLRREVVARMTQS